MKIPEGYSRVMPYLIIEDAAKFIVFTQSVFGAVDQTERKSMRDEKTIMHGEITIGDSTIMFADSTQEFQPRTAGLFIYVHDADTVYKKALDAGAVSIQAPSDQPYGRSCGVTDPFGNQWWITSLEE